MKDMGKVKFKEGIDKYKFIADLQGPNADEVYELVGKFGYDIEFDGRSVKILTVPTKPVYFHDNEPELTVSEIEHSLEEIKKLGLEEAFGNNMSLNSLRSSFVARVEWCVNNNLPFMDQENNFLTALNTKKTFADYSTQVPLKEVKTVSDTEAMEEMDAEDRQVYNQVVESLNYLILQNPTNEYLPKIVANITKNIVGSLKRKEYRFLPLNDIVQSVMYEGIDVTPEMQELTDLILSAFPLDRTNEESRGLA